MVSEAYLIISRRGKLRLAHRQPQVNNTELMVKLRVDIPATLFDRMTPVANLAITSTQQIAPISIEIPVFTELQGRNTNTNQRQ